MKKLSNYRLCELNDMICTLQSTFNKYAHVHGEETASLEAEIWKFKNALDEEYQKRETAGTI